MRTRVIIEAARIQLRLVAAIPSTYVSTAVMPIVYLVLQADLVTAGHAATPVRRVVLLGIWGGTVWNCGLTLRWDSVTGVLSSVLATGARVGDVILGRCAGAVIFTTAVVLTATGATVVLIEPAAFADAARSIPALVAVAGPCAVAAGYFLSTMLIAARTAYRVAELALYVVLLLGGVIIPVSALAAPLRSVSVLISLYWAQRSTTDGPIAAMIAFGLSIAYVGLARIRLHRSLRRLRATGTVDHV
jgi:ABC-2 type transport system permease protein